MSSDSRRAHEALVARILEGRGTVSHAQRCEAFDNAGTAEPMRVLAEKVAEHANEITDEDVAAARGAGLSEDQIFEIVVCAAGRRGHAVVLGGLRCPPSRY